MAPASEQTPRPVRLADRLEDASFVSLQCFPDGDALAATGLLARALAETDTPFETAVRSPWDARPSSDTDCTVRIGPFENSLPDSDSGSPAPDEGDSTFVLAGRQRPASLDASVVAREIGVRPSPALGLAGAFAASVRDGIDPFETDSIAESVSELRDRGRERGVLGARRAGIATPTGALEGFAFGTLSHTAFAGDLEATRSYCGALMDDEAGRDRASLLCLSVVEPEASTQRAAFAVERSLRPIALESGPFATVEGYADVLTSVATERPGTGLALALGFGVREAALEAWRAHATRVHATLRSARYVRYQGLSVARVAPTEGGTDSTVDETSPVPVATIARLFRDFRAPEPVCLVVGNRRGALSATTDRALGRVTRRAASECNGTGGGTPRAARARFEADPEAFVAAVRTALAEEIPTPEASEP